MLSTVARTARTRVAAQARVSRRFLNAEAPKAPAGEPKKGGNGGVIGLLAVAAAAGGAYYYYSGEAAAPAAAPAAKSVDYKKISEEVADALESETHDDGSFGPVLVRLGWHSSGTFDKEKNDGGSDGAGMRFAPESKWGANAGLDKARAVVEAIKAKHPEITYSDLWILAANTAIEEMGGPHCAFRPGRSDKAEDCSPLPDGRLPDADGRGKNPADHLRDIFYRQGFNDQEIVALAGAHAIGRCHTENSGYWGPWTNAPTTFSNEFFRSLLDEKWTKKTKHEGKKWEGPEQFENPAGNLMMLPTDLSLVEDKEFRPWVEKYAKDEELFFKDFAAAWTKLTENGCKNLAAQPAL